MGNFSKIKIKKLNTMSTWKCNRNMRENEGGEKNAGREEEGRRVSWVVGTIGGVVDTHTPVPVDLMAGFWLLDGLLLVPGSIIRSSMQAKAVGMKII